MSRKPDPDSVSRSHRPETPHDPSDERITNTLRKMRPDDPPRSDALETFYQAGYQAALAASQTQPVRSNGLTGFAWGSLGGAILTAAILLSIVGISAQPANHPALGSAATATVDSGSNVAAVVQDAEPPATTTEESDGEESAAEKVETPTELASSPAFDVGSTLAMLGLRNNRRAVNEKLRAGVTIDDLARQRSWQPLWSQLRTASEVDSEPTERVASSAYERPRAASVWQLRKQIEEIAL